MSQRWIAFTVAAPLTLLLLALALVVPLPYSIYSPGPTFDVLGKDANESEIIQVVGHKTYRDDGQIRFTTVQTTARDRKEPLFSALGAWIDPDEAVVPYEIAHPPDQSAKDEEIQGAVSMVGSQDAAIANAVRELGYSVDRGVQVAYVDKEGAAFGKLRVRDKFRKVDGRPVTTADDIIKAVQSHGPGDPVSLVMERNHKPLKVEIAPEKVDGEMRIGVTLGIGYDFPFDVTIQVDPAIGGPSAGLMFSLGVYDTLTPGSLTDGQVIAGTGEIFDDGTVGPIGGIAQKIAGAEAAGAELFFVPKDNCDAVEDIDTDMELVKATSLHEALDSLEAWDDDRDADLPHC